MKVRWLKAEYGFRPEQSHIAVPATARDKLVKLADELVGTDDLIGIYIPEGIDDVWQTGPMKGRVVGAVRLLPMPVGRRPEDYFDRDVFESATDVPRWPFGWPCDVVVAIDPEKTQTLRSMVFNAHPKSPFGIYAAQFQQGPIRLGFEMLREVNREFERLFGPPPWPVGTTNLASRPKGSGLS